MQRFKARIRSPTALVMELARNRMKLPGSASAIAVSRSSILHPWPESHAGASLLAGTFRRARSLFQIRHVVQATQALSASATPSFSNVVRLVLLSDAQSPTLTLSSRAAWKKVSKSPSSDVSLNCSSSFALCSFHLVPVHFRCREAQGLHAFSVQWATQLVDDDVVGVVARGGITRACKFLHLGKFVGFDSTVKLEGRTICLCNVLACACCRCHPGTDLLLLARVCTVSVCIRVLVIASAEHSQFFTQLEEIHSRRHRG